MSSARLRLAIDISMKVAGRKMVESTSTPARPGCSAASAASTSRVTCSVLPSGCFSTIRSRPGPSLITASPIGGGKPSTTSATSPRRRTPPERTPPGAPAGASRCGTAIRARSAASFTDETCATARRWLGVSMKPPAATEVASRVAVITSCSVTPLARNRSGSTSTCNCRSRCPQMATLATPGMAIRRGRIVHRVSVVRSTCDRVVDDTPIFMTRLSDDSGDKITGGRTAEGSVAATRDKRS